MNRGELNKILEPILAKKTTAEWCEILDKAGVPGGPIRTTVEIFTDPVIQERGDIIELVHSKAGKLKILTNPIRMTDTSVEYSPAPVLGANSEEILKGLGYDAGEVSALRGKGVL